MIVELTALGRNGQQLPGYIKCLVHGPQVFFYITQKTNVEDQFIFNKIEEESVGNEVKMSNNANRSTSIDMPHNVTQTQPWQIQNCNVMNGNN